MDHTRASIIAERMAAVALNDYLMGASREQAMQHAEDAIRRKYQLSEQELSQVVGIAYAEDQQPEDR